MKLYLIRHAQPQSSGTNPILTDVGRKQAHKLGEMFVRLSLPTNNTRILTSELRRAHQTAKIIYGELPVDAFADLAAPAGAVGASVQNLMTRLRTEASDGAQQIILVWHSPYVGAALNFLLGSTVLEWPADHGATAYVECDNNFGAGSGRLRWFILPQLLS